MAGVSPRDQVAMDAAPRLSYHSSEAEPLGIPSNHVAPTSDAGGRLGDGDGRLQFADIHSEQTRAIMEPVGGILHDNSSVRQRHLEDQPSKGAEPPRHHPLTHLLPCSRHKPFGP